jgi:hypothetical protein
MVKGLQCSMISWSAILLFFVAKRKDLWIKWIETKENPADEVSSRSGIDFFSNLTIEAILGFLA